MSGIGDTVTVELFLDSVWTDITSYVRATMTEGVTITFGIQGESGTADPSECNLTVNNRDGRFSPRNPEGPWYGLLKRNTPLRVTVGTEVRYVGEVSEFPARWDPTGNDVWVPLTASGVLRRLVRYSALQSPLRTLLPSLDNITAYWPIEDGPGSTSFASGLAGGSPMSIVAGTPTYATVDGGPGSDLIAGFNGVDAQGPAPVTPGSSSFTLGFLLTMPDGGTANGARLAQVNTNGTAQQWVITYTTGGALRLRAYDSAGTLLEDTSAAFTLDGNTRFVKLEVTDDGADVDWALSVTGIGTISDTIVGYQVTSPSTVILGTSASITTEVGIGHVVVADTADALVSSDFDAAEDGYAGESAEDRFERVGDEIGVLTAVLTNTSGDVADSTLLGVQPIADPLTIMRDLETADAGGILRDSLNVANSIVFATRRFRYNTDPVVELDYAAGHLTPPLSPVDDDQLLANDVIATRTDGGSARATDTTSELAALDYPDGVGTYQKTVTVNVQTDGMLPDVANWLLTEGTLNKPRFPQITVDLVENPSLATDVDQIRPGSLITVANLPDWASHSTVHLHVLGWVETITSHRREFTFNCVPADTYDVVRLDDDQYGRLDSDTTVTSEALDTTETGVDYTGDTWITTATHPSEFPFDIEIGGEVMTVTSATGTTFTVTRSANGVVKSHDTAQPIRVARPNRLAL